MPNNDNDDSSNTPTEQQETSDWTEVLKLNEKSDVEPLSVKVLAPNVVPHNIPYLEVYRTDELYAKDYVSPFMTPPSTSTTTDGGGSESSGDGGGSSSQSNMHDSPHSSKNKNKNLSRDLENILRNHYKKTTNFPVLIKRYLNCKTNKASIEAVHKRSFKNLKPGTDMASLTSAILKVKRKYT